MALSLATVGARITATFVNAIVALVNKQGMTSIIPTSVAGTGVTLGSGGKVTAGAATTISVNGCFTSDYDNYRIICDFTLSSAAADPTFQVRLAGTDLTTGTYVSVRQSIPSTTPAYSFSATATSINFGRVNGTGGGAVVMDIMGPALSSYTKVTLMGSDALTGQTSWGTVLNSTGYDGFSIKSGGATTLTGSIRIYGYNNN